jgi:prepilin-type processing-associated H-X9-DG protein
LFLTFEGTRFTACRYRRGEDRIELALDPGGQPLRSLPRCASISGRARQSLRFAMNAGMYDAPGDRSASMSRRPRAPRPQHAATASGNFHLEAQRRLTVDNDGRVAVVSSERYRRCRQGPLGDPVRPNAGDRRRTPPQVQRRRQLALCSQRRRVRMPTPPGSRSASSQVSFGRFARLFRDRLGCANALFLDGSVSSLWDRPANRVDAYPALGPLDRRLQS